MKSLLWIVGGALLIILGALWTFQGLGYLAGSVMTGQTLWAVIGPITALVGVVVVIAGIRRTSAT